MNGGKKRRRKNKRKTRRKRGGVSNQALVECNERLQKQNIGMVKRRKMCIDSDGNAGLNKQKKASPEQVPKPVVQPKPVVAPVVAPVVQQTFVDDDTASYGRNKNGSCKHLRDTYFNPGHHNKVRERCNKEAGKHCKKTCDDNKKFLEKKFEVTKNVLENRLKNTQKRSNVMKDANKALDETVGACRAAVTSEGKKYYYNEAGERSWEKNSTICLPTENIEDTGNTSGNCKGETYKGGKEYWVIPGDKEFSTHDKNHPRCIKKTAKPGQELTKGTEGCDEHNYYKNGKFVKSTGNVCRKDKRCNVTKGKKKMKKRKCITRSGGRRKQKRKTKRKRRKNKKTRKRKMKGGSGKGLLVNPACSGFGCDMPTNVGKLMTGYDISNKTWPDPMSLNRNVKHPYKPVPMNYNKKGGRKKGRKGMKGGFFLDNWGLGDGLLSYYKGTNAALNAKHLYAGNKPEMRANPTYQPELLKPVPSSHNAGNLPNYYQAGTTKAISFNLGS